MATVFDAAAEHLLGCTVAGVPGDDARRLLADLGYLHATGAEASEARLINRIALLRAAGHMRRLFMLSSREAPGLVFMGAEADPAILGATFAGLPIGSPGGSGLTLRDAFESCIGEGIEYLSGFEHEGDVVASPETGLPRPAVFDMEPPTPDAESVRATRIHDGAPALLPATRSLRRRPSAGAAPPYALSTGCAAGVTVEAAALNGLMELIERDAAALWWLGGRPGRPVALDDAATRQASELLASFRRGVESRRSCLIDITTDLGVPCIVALSVLPDGRGLAYGISARPTTAAAALSAIRELCQTELAYDVVEAKRKERGEAAFNEADQRHIARATLIDAAACALLHPTGLPVRRDSWERSDAADTLTTLVAHLAAQGHDIYGVNLTRPFFGVPVVRVVAPSLQLAPGGPESARLRQTIQDFGGGEAHTGGVALL